MGRDTAAGTRADVPYPLGVRSPDGSGRSRLPAEDRAVRPIQPDLVGEALVLAVLGQLSEAKALGTVLRVSALARPRVVPFVLRLVQDYATSAQHRAVGWAEALGRQAEATTELNRFVDLLPKTTVVLRGLAADLTGLLLERCRAEATSQAELARIGNNLASFLSQLGRRGEALERAEEAVETAPDTKLLGPIEEVFQRLQSEG